MTSTHADPQIAAALAFAEAQRLRNAQVHHQSDNDLRAARAVADPALLVAQSAGPEAVDRLHWGNLNRLL